MNINTNYLPTKRSALWLVASAAFTSSVFAQQNPMQIDVTGARESTTSILTPTKILQGNELQDKLGTTLGATIGNELGVSQTGYAAGASRPVMRGLEGARVQILQNGLAVGDLSALSPDHATASAIANTRQIEILRGAAALLYGTGSSGGIVNVVNDRILSNLPDKPTGALRTGYESVSNGRAASGVVEASHGSIALHVDTSINNNQHYRFPGNSALNGKTDWSVAGLSGVNRTGKLRNSFDNSNDLGVGASLVHTSGYTGVSVERLNREYGVPTVEGGKLQLGQSRYDFKHETRDPFSGISKIKLNAAQNQYIHHEFNKNYVRTATFKNNANEVRLELVHQPIMGWKGTFGTQLIAQDTNAKEVSGVYAILPQTKTNTNALFLIEENRWGSLQANLGLRYDSAKLNPTNTTYTTADKNLQGNAATTTLPSTSNKSFNLLSYSAGGLWNFTQGYASGLSYTVMQRAPSASELFAYGTHESTATFVIGNSNLNKETSHNLELNLQKTTGLINGKLNVFANRFTNYIYNYYLGSTFTGGEDGFATTQSRQASATIKGIEGELTHNWGNVGSGVRLFADASQGTFDAGGNLPLQPAPRIGLQVAHQKNGWLANASYSYSFQQNRLATWEVGPTPSYNLLNAGLSYTEKINSTRWTAFAQVKNILNESIRYATTPMAVRLYAPQPGRSLMIGVRANF